MTEQFIEAIKQSATYRRKEGTATSYYWATGAKILPDRISISKESEMKQTRHTGRNPLHKIVGQLMGTFKKNERSPLKLHKPFQLRTNLWEMEDFPSFLGYGTIGISNQLGKIDRQSDTGDLIVLHTTTKDWKEITIYYFAGSVMDLESIMEHLYKRIR
jgi:hypothetical protein